MRVAGSRQINSWKTSKQPKTKILTLILCLKIKSASFRRQQVCVSSEFDVHLPTDKCCLAYTLLGCSDWLISCRRDSEGQPERTPSRRIWRLHQTGEDAALVTLRYQLLPHWVTVNTDNSIFQRLRCFSVKLLLESWKALKTELWIIQEATPSLRHFRIFTWMLFVWSNYTCNNRAKKKM